MITRNLKESKTFPLDIPLGYYVLVQATTMAGFTIRIVIRDSVSGKVYFDKTRKSLSPIPPISDFFLADCENPELFIDIPQSAQIDLRIKSMDIADLQGVLITRTISIVGEDYIDKDYNDIILNLTILKSNR